MYKYLKNGNINLTDKDNLVIMMYMKNVKFSNNTGLIIMNLTLYLVFVFLLLFVLDASARINLPKIPKALQISKEYQNRL